MEFPLGIADIDNYAHLFAQKIKQIEDEFEEFAPPKLVSFASPADHFRMRAEFKVWHEEDTAHYAMYKPGEYKKPIKISTFTIGSSVICRLMPELLAKINCSALLKRKLFQVEFLTTSTGDSVVTLIYHKTLDEEWRQEAEILSNALDTKIIGRSRGQKVVLTEDFVTEEFVVNDKRFRYQQIETGFTQPNASVCRDMLTWAQDSSRDIGGDLLELYCGNGNFTLPLAENFNRVLATEVSKTSVNSALHNIQINAANNISVVRMSSEEFTSALNGEREFRRLRDIDLANYEFSTVFVDPPRAGLDHATEKMVSGFDNILYISCHPGTLKSNLRTLCKSHEINAFAFFDQFPYTHHRECGVLLKRK